MALALQSLIRNFLNLIGQRQAAGVSSNTNASQTMKTYSVLVFALALNPLLQCNGKLVGKYKFVPSFGKEYFITINKSIYAKTFSSGETNRGVVEYGKNFIYLRDYQKELKNINSREVYTETQKLKEGDLIALEVGKKDSINYCHHVYEKNGPTNWLDVCVETGKMIRIK